MMNFYKMHNRLVNNSEMCNGIDILTQLAMRHIGPSNKDKLQPVLHIIKKSPYLILAYACDVINQRWEEAEPILLKAKDEFEFVYTDDDTAYRVYVPNILVWYAMDVMKSRWEEAEEIMKYSIDWPRYAEAVGL